MKHEDVKERYIGFWYKVSKTVLRFYKLFCLNSIQLEGKENLLPGQPKIILANHSNATDAFVLPFIFPDKLHFLIQEVNFSIPVFGRLLALADQIPVVLGRGRGALSTSNR
jgi:1-acyl-sn-glycerol-3-phosphate acyltransferase